MLESVGTHFGLFCIKKQKILYSAAIPCNIVFYYDNVSDFVIIIIHLFSLENLMIGWTYPMQWYKSNNILDACSPYHFLLGQFLLDSFL